MAEREVKDVAGVAESVCDPPGAAESQLSAEDDSSVRPAALYKQDLKSVLVTSVLNLEQLDADLYR